MHLGIVQMGLSSDIDKNTQKILTYIELANKRNINIVCFPECALTGYIVDHFKVKKEQIRKGISQIQKASNIYNVSAIVGTSWYSNNNLYNSAAIIRPNSRIKLYFKNDLTEYDKTYFSKGDSTLSFAVNRIRCGVLICRDQNNPLLAAKYRNIDLLFYLSSHYYSKAEAIKKERKNKAFPIVRALENSIYVAKADAVGKQNTRVSIGNSIVVNPEGYVITEAKRWREEMLEFDL